MHTVIAHFYFKKAFQYYFKMYNFPYISDLNLGVCFGFDITRDFIKSIIGILGIYLGLQVY